MPAGGGIVRLYAVLWRYARGMRGRLVLALVMLVTAQVLRITIPWLFGLAIDVLQTDGAAGVPTAGGYLAAMLGVAMAAWVLHGPARVLERRVALHAREQLADDLFARLVALPLRWHEQHHSGETLHRLQATQAALFGFAQNQFIFLQNAVGIVGPIIALLALSPAVGGVALAGYGAIAIVLLRFDRVMMRLIRDENAAERRYTASVVDSVGNIGTVLALGLGAPLRSLVRARHAEVSVPLRRSFVVNEAKWGAIDLLNNAMRVGLVALYAWLAYRDAGAILVGSIVVVHAYAQQVGGVVSSMAGNWTDLVKRQADIACADPIWDATPQPELATADADRAWQSIRIDGATLRHPNGARGLSDLSLELRRGARVALVGGSGAGKSTLLRVLAGMYPADAIRITIDGHATARTDLAGLALLVPQEPEIFDSDVRTNLTLGVPRSDAELARACELTCLGPVISALPAGYATAISERGANLSGGQRQRLALARGLLAADRASLVLLDEPTSSVDPITEGKIYDGVLGALGDACVVSAIHRLHLLSRFDTVVLLDGGAVVDTGSFADLLARQPRFQELWREYTAAPADAAERAA
nr:ABC transporter ATP-binding protein [Kofleriaceae bacterium]